MTEIGLPSNKCLSSSNIGLTSVDNVCFDKFVLKFAKIFSFVYTFVAGKLFEKLLKCEHRFNLYSSKGVKPDSYSFFKCESKSEF